MWKIVPYGLAVSFVTMLSSLIYLKWVRGKWSRNNVLKLQMFGVGVLIGVGLMLLEESYIEIGFLHTLIYSVLGVVFFVVIGTLNDFLFGIPGGRLDAYRVILTDIFHNISDGIVLASVAIVGGSVGLSIFIGVLLHELFQEISETAYVSKHIKSGKKVLVINVLSSFSILIGFALTYALVIHEGARITEFLIPFTGGGTLFLMLRDPDHGILSGLGGKRTRKGRTHGFVLAGIIFFIMLSSVVSGI